MDPYSRRRRCVEPLIQFPHREWRYAALRLQTDGDRLATVLVGSRFSLIDAREALFADESETREPR
jgi:hypothetical protein